MDESLGIGRCQAQNYEGGKGDRCTSIEGDTIIKRDETLLMPEDRRSGRVPGNHGIRSR